MRALLPLPLIIACVLPPLAGPDNVARADAPGDHPSGDWLRWQSLPPLPDSLGVAGPFVGVDQGAGRAGADSSGRAGADSSGRAGADPSARAGADALIVAGGANFPKPHWENDKQWVADAWVLVRDQPADATDEPASPWRWIDGLKLDRPVAYGACANTSHGVACFGGTDGQETFRRSFLLRWNPSDGRLEQSPLPDLPKPCAYGAATAIGDVVYLAGGQSGLGLETAMNNLWRLDLSRPKETWAWEILPAWPGPACAFNLTVAQHNGFDWCVYVISGRRQQPETTGLDGIEPLVDVWEFNPLKHERLARQADRPAADAEPATAWRRRADVPQSVMAGTGAAVGQSHVFVLSGADGSLMAQTDRLKLDHPGFPRRVWAYHTITDTWIDAGPSPANQVTTPAARWGNRIILASGEIKPRVRTRAVWSIEPVVATPSFGAINATVLIGYLAGMLGIGIYFARKNKNTDDYFRGGKKVLWWAAACSIFATMLSSITFMAIPAKAYAQDMAYLIGNLMIPVVAPIAVFIALPFFRRIDATSAYEYLEKRFNRPVRLFASASFTLFHIFRIGIVLSLAALALTTVTPLTPVQSVLIMGGLSIAYCTLGGVEAVIWTDTIQTVVLLGGALICFALLMAGVEGGIGQFFATTNADGKLNLVNWHLDPTTASLALWVVVVGGIGQNISSYTADQAVVQRYMTTPDERRAARSIWASALLCIPASLLFYFIGAGLYAFYKSNPERLDPTFMTDQIFPLFIAREVPVGLAGLIVAGIFAAAQSTVSTSMNSTATAVVTDFLRPLNLMKSERGYLNWARTLTFTLGWDPLESTCRHASLSIL